MALPTPSSAKEVDQRAKIDVQRELATSNPFLRNSWLGSLVTAFSNRVFDFYYFLTQAALEAIPDTAVVLLSRWAAIWGITRTPASVATGNLVATGTVGKIIPSGTVYAASDGKTYTTQEAATVTQKAISVDSLTFAAGTVTLTTDADHGIASNVLIAVSGATDSDYDVTGKVCTVTGAKTLTYTVTGSPATPENSSPATLTVTTGVLVVNSDGFGNAQNQLLDASLTVQSPINGVADAVSVDFGTLGGGTDQEIVAAFRTRFLDRIQKPVAHFNVAEITSVAKTVAGVTRVFVQEVTPAVGQVTIYFMRDNDTPSIPDAAEVVVVKAALDTIRPVNTAPADMIVAAPLAVPTNFALSALSPDTASMRLAITASLEQFFAETPEVGVAIPEDAYRSAIFNTVDLTNADVVVSFTLTSPPSGAIAITSGEIGTLGTVTYP